MRLRRLLSLGILFALALGFGSAEAKPHAPQQAYAVEVPGLGPLVLFGRDAKSAVHNYVEGLIRRDVFPGSAKALRAWARSLPVDAAQPVSSLGHAGMPVSGLQLNSVTDLIGDGKRSRGPGALVEALNGASVFPLFLPVADAHKNIAKHVALVDHLLFMGGADIHPITYGKPITFAHRDQLNLKRDQYELSLMEKGSERELPIDGICRGHQLLNVATSGELVQDLKLDGVTKLPHAGPGFSILQHAVKVVPGSALEKTIGGSQIDAVPSLHHEAVGKVGPGMKIVGLSPDGVVEAIESSDGRMRGYQFHPEAARASESSKAIFASIGARARKYAKSVKR